MCTKIDISLPNVNFLLAQSIYQLVSKTIILNLKYGKNQNQHIRQYF